MRRLIVTIAFLALAIFPAIGINQAAAETIRIGGSGKEVGTMELLAAAFERDRPGTKVLVAPELGTNGGFKALTKNAIDILVANRPLSPAEASPDLVEIVYARTPFVIVSNVSQQVDSITLAELADAYSGRRATWPDGTRIRLVLRSANGADTRLLRQFSPEVDAAVQLAIARPGMLITASDKETLRLVKDVPGAIGATTLAAVRTGPRLMKAMKLGGVTPGTATLADGSYPFYVTMRLVRKRQASDTVLQFVEFVKSPAGNAILQSVGNWAPPE